MWVVPDADSGQSNREQTAQKSRDISRHHLGINLVFTVSPEERSDRCSKCATTQRLGGQTGRRHQFLRSETALSGKQEAGRRARTTAYYRNICSRHDQAMCTNRHIIPCGYMDPSTEHELSSGAIRADERQLLPELFMRVCTSFC